MRKIDAFFALLGVVIGGLLTAYAYYSNAHSGAPRISEISYLILFPPSIGLMATENATVLGQMAIISIVVALNGVLYGSISFLAGMVLGKRSTRKSS